MAPSSKNKNLTLSGVLKSLKETGKYDYPKDLEGFYLMATSQKMMNHIIKEDIFVKNTSEKNLNEIILKKIETKTGKSKPKTNKYSTKKLKQIAEDFLKNDSSEQPFLFANVFKRFIPYYYKGESILIKCSDKLAALYGIDLYRLDQKAKMNEQMKMINKLPQESICIMAHLIYLGKIFIETNEGFKNHKKHDSAVTKFFEMMAQDICKISDKEVMKRQKNTLEVSTDEKNSTDNSLKANEDDSNQDFFHPTKYESMQQVVFDIWREELDFIPNLSAKGRKMFNQKLTVFEVLKSLNETGIYDYPSELEGFYKMATSDQMMKLITQKGAFVESCTDEELKQIITPKEKQDSKDKTKKINYNKYSPKQLTEIAKKFLRNRTQSAILFTTVFKNLTFYYFKGLSVLNDIPYADLERLYELFADRKSLLTKYSDLEIAIMVKRTPTNMKDTLMECVNQLPEITICVIAHLIYLSIMFLRTRFNFKKYKNHDNDLKVCLESGPTAIICSKGNSKALEFIILYCWQQVFDFTPTLSDEEQTKHPYFKLL